MADLMDRPVSKWVVCPRCLGTRTLGELAAVRLGGRCPGEELRRRCGWCHRQGYLALWAGGRLTTIPQEYVLSGERVGKTEERGCLEGEGLACELELVRRIREHDGRLRR